jgi:hypothetical protein
MKKLLIILIIVNLNIKAHEIDHLALKSLSTIQVSTLEKQYLAYSSNYKENNRKELLEEIPIISTNPHHRSVQYWLRHQLRKGNLKDLPILHIDSHTDMGFSPSHYKFRNQFLPVRTLLDQLSDEKIKSFNQSLTDISQVLIPAVAIGLSRKIHMCMPPWYKRTKSFGKPILFNVSEINRANFVNAKTNRFYPTTDARNNNLNSPFIHKKFNGLPATIIFHKCFQGDSPKLKSDYILSLDLDVLSTNGSSHDPVRPISDYRSKNKKVNSIEFKNFKKRLNRVIDIINELKKKGFSPRIITIADSTLKTGGNYTPTALAYLANKYLNKYFKKKFREETR